METVVAAIPLFASYLVVTIFLYLSEYLYIIPEKNPTIRMDMNLQFIFFRHKNAFINYQVTHITITRFERATWIFDSPRNGPRS